MATLRPAVKQNDSYIEKIIKYIPAEIVAGYTAIAGYLAYDTGLGIPDYYVGYFQISVISLLVFAFLWTFYAVKDNSYTNDENLNNKSTWFHAFIAMIAYIVWVYALGNPLLKAWFCGYNTLGIENCGLFSPTLGSIILVLFTVMVPILERLFLGANHS